MILMPRNILIFGWIGRKHVQIISASPTCGLGDWNFLLMEGAQNGTSVKATKH